jgi:hypothetical protein
MTTESTQSGKTNPDALWTGLRAARSVAAAAAIAAMLIGSVADSDAQVGTGGTGVPHRGAVHRGGAGLHRGGVGWRGGAVGRPGWHGGGVRWGGWARPGRYWWGPGGAIAAGAAIGVVSAATAAAWAGATPGPGLCWYYTDPSRAQGFWDACQ